MRIEILHHLRVRFGVVRLGGAGQQLEHPFLRMGGGIAGARCGGQQGFHAVAAGVEQLAVAAHLGEAADDAGEDGVGLRCPECVPWRTRICHSPTSAWKVPAASERNGGSCTLLMASAVSRNENDRLVAEMLRDSLKSGYWRRRCDSRAPGGRRWRRSSGVARLRSRSLSAMKIFSGSFSTALRQSAKSASRTSSGSFQVVARRGQLAVVLALRMIDEQVLPDIQAAGDVRLAVGVDAQPRGEQHHVGVGAEDRTRRTGTGDAAAHRGVEALHARGVGQVILHRTLNARQGVVEAGEPAIVLGHQLVEERGALVGRCAGKFGPRRPRTRWPPGHHGLAVANLEHAAEEIEHVRDRLSGA